MINFSFPTTVYARRWIWAALAMVLCSQAIRAGEAANTRWLLVFDSSYSMKKLLPGAESAVTRMLTSNADGELQKGDSVAVWVYDQQILTNQLPPIAWNPERAATMGSNLVRFLQHQQYQNDSRLSALDKSLVRVIQDSERLTIVIFCDGQSDIDFTPYDDGVNQSFHDSLAERRDSGQPFVVALRTQLGNFVGCTVSYPPANINFPNFPPLPKPAPPTNAPAMVEAKTSTPPKAEVPSLVIVGDKVSTNLNTMAAPVPPATNPPVVETETQTNKPEVPSVSSATNNVAAVTSNPPSVSQEIPITQTQVVSTNLVGLSKTNTAPSAMATKHGDRQTRILIAIGVGLLLLAVALVVVLATRGRRPRGSLISSSMQDRPPRK